MMKMQVNGMDATMMVITCKLHELSVLHGIMLLTCLTCTLHW